MTIMKKCYTCNKELPLTHFYKNSTKKDGVQTQCKKCMSELHKEYYKKHSEECKLSHRRYYQNNKQNILMSNKQWYIKNKNEVLTKRKQYAKDNREKCKIQFDKWRKRPENKKKIAGYARKMRENPVFHEKCRLRRLVRHTMDSRGKNRSSVLPPIIGCSTKELYKHLIETWEKNYGKPFINDTYQIDHILPLCTAKNIESVHKLFHYSNMQLLTPQDNAKKRDIIISCTNKTFRGKRTRSVSSLTDP